MKIPPARPADREVAAFLAAHRSVDLTTFDFTDRVAVAGLGLPPERADGLLTKVRTRQRVRRLTTDDASTDALLTAGFDSAHRIAAVPEHRFVREQAHLFGGDRAAAEHTHRRAGAIKAAVTHLYANLHGTLGSPHFKALHGNNVPESLGAYFADVPSYQDLFGSLDHLSCAHCASIFGPAAYFTDLMRITDDYITDPNPAIPAGYHLVERRPDLFETALTCANTNDELPMLEVVNTILARRVAGSGQVTAGIVVAATADTVTLAAGPGGYLGLQIMIVSGTGVGQVRTIVDYQEASRTASVGEAWATVPDTTSAYVVAPDPYATLAAAPYPFNLPFNKPLSQVRRNLDVLRTGLPELYTAVASPVTGGQAAGGGPTEVVLADSASTVDGAYAAMWVSLIGGPGAGQVRLVTGYAGATRTATVDRPWDHVPDATTQYHVSDPAAADRETTGLSVEQYALVTTPVTGAAALAPYYGMPVLDVTALSVVDVFCTRTGLDRARLAALLTQGLSAAEQAAGLAGEFFVNATGEGLPPMAIIEYDAIAHLSVARLDRLNRFIRLADVLGWDFESLDWALRTAGPGGIDPAAVGVLAAIVRLRELTGLDAVELCALWSDVKTTGRGNGPVPADLFDRTFNQPAVLGGVDPYGSIAPVPFDPARPLPWNPEGTGQSDAVIRARLLSALGVGDDDLTRLAAYLRALLDTGPVLRLDLPALSWLHRLAGTARALRLTVDEYLVLLDLTHTPDVRRVPTAGGVLAQRERAEWLRRSGFTVYTMLYVLRGIRTPNFRPPYTADGIAPFVNSLSASAQSARLGTESFGYTGIGEEESAGIFQALVAARLVTDLGILLDDSQRYDTAAAAFPLSAGSFVTVDITRADSELAYRELREADPPVLVPHGPDSSVLARTFNQDTDLGYLFTGEPDAANKRNQVSHLLLDTKQRIDVTLFASLFPIGADRFTSRQITPAASARAFGLLAAQDPVLIRRDPAAGQQRLITAYDGASRMATVDSPWHAAPTAVSGYRVSRPVTAGTAQGGALFTVVLAADAAPHNGAYTGMTVALTGGPGAGETGVVTGYDGDTRSATLATPWTVLPDATSRYTVTAPADAGRARGAGGITITLAPGASTVDGHYVGMTVTIAETGQLGAAYDADTPLDFLFQSQGTGQRRTVVGYDGTSRTATVEPAWDVVPDATTSYTVGAGGHPVTAGTARGGGANTILLAPEASEVDGAYVGTVLDLVDDPAADLRRGEVAQAMRQTLSAVTHTAGVISAAAALQQGYASQGLADFLGTTTARLTVLVPAATRVADLSDYLDELLTPIVDGQVPPGLPPLIETLARGLVLFDTLGLTIDQIIAVTEMPRAFNVVDPAAATFDEVVSLSAVTGLVRRFADTHDDLIAYLRRPVDPVVPGPKVDALSALSGWPAAQIGTLVTLWWPAGAGASAYDYTTVDGIARFADCFDIGDRTGLDVDSLRRLGGLAYLPATDPVGGRLGPRWRTYTDAAQLTLDAVRAGSAAPDFAVTNAESVALLNEAARDALLGYALWVTHRVDPRITGPATLYEYLLIDVQVAGCATTSYIAQGISALQLYQQRCRLMLEPGVTDLTNIPDSWWEWMSGYRLWEANRKVFLYPENYLRPALRRDATPAFAALANTLLATDVTDASTKDAYHAYFDDFATVANLVMMDAYQTRTVRAGTSVVRTQGHVADATATTVTLADTASDLFNAYIDQQVEITGGPGVGQRRSVTGYANRMITVAQPWTTTLTKESTYLVSGPELVDTLFLIGRTNTDPATYYHRRYDSDRGWQPWLAVGVTITAPFVTPVYAFDRLFLYWVEPSTVGSSTIHTPGANQTRSQAVTAVSTVVKFAFLGPDGTWSAAQTAEDERVIDYQLDYALDPYVDDALPNQKTRFDPALGYWQKAQPLHLPAAKVTEPHKYPNGEQILVNQGLALPFSEGQQWTVKGPPSKAMPAQQYQFQGAAWTLSNGIYEMTKAALHNTTGYLPFAPWLTVSSSLTRASLPLALLDYDRQAQPQPYLPVIARATNAIGVNLSTSWNVVLDNYWSDDYPDARNLLHGPTVSLPLLGNANGALASVVTVKNFTGAFLIDNGDESFLVRTTDAGVRQLSDIVTATADSPSLPPGFLYVRAGRFTTTNPAPPLASMKFQFTRLSTRAARVLAERLSIGGLPALLSLSSQRTPEAPFARLQPSAGALPPSSTVLDFSGAYGTYLWELFFHGPFLVADALRTGRRFREAKTWFEYIYRPTQQPEPGDTGQDRFWRFLPFRSMDVPSLARTLSDPAQITAYNDDPFDPDAIARLRISAYAKAIVMRYVDNLLDWADDLYTQDTRESVDEATNLYVLAQDLLGPRPESLGECAPTTPATYNDIKASYADRTLATGAITAAGTATVVLEQSASPVTDAYTGAYVAVASGKGAGEVGYIVAYDGRTRTATVEAPWTVIPASGPGSSYRVYVDGIPQFLIRLENTTPVLAAGNAPVALTDVPFNDIGGYFCVPENDQLIGVWDRADDRLFKIRHCMDITGQVRSLALYAPELNPADLIRGATSGVAAPGTTGQLGPAVPNYRFDVLIQRAKEVGSTVAALGSELLSTLEKKDAEALSALRVKQEHTLLNLLTAVKQAAVAQCVDNGESLTAALASAKHRRDHYAGLVEAGLSASERDSIRGAEVAVAYNVLSGLTRAASSIGYAAPQVGSPFAMTYGGQQLGSVLFAASGVLDAGAQLAMFESQMSLTMAQYERRESEWQLQADLAAYDITQIEAQLAANEVQRGMAQRDLTVHLTSIAQNDEIAAFLRDKFTNEQLYQWMAARLSTLHFQTYALALELARSAQRAFQFELDRDTTFVNFGYWDGGRRGLLAGEGLLLALNQMEKAYLDRNTRPLNIEKTVSLAQLDPLALRDLVATGECLFALPEKLFDDDYPGQYARKISSVAVSVPAVTGPYQNLHGVLSQLSNQVVVAPDVNAVDFLLGGGSATVPGPDVLRVDWRVNQQIALSTGMGDTGVFDTSAVDGRYLPFEGTGAVSTWRLRLPKQTNHFDFTAVADVLVHLRYQARDGGPRFREQVERLPAMSTYNGTVTLSLAQTFSGQWYEFLHQPTGPVRQSLHFALADLVPPHIAAPVLTGWSLHLQTPVPPASRRPYVHLALGSGVDETVNLNAAGDHTELLGTRPPIGAVEGPATLSFLLADTPNDLLTPPPPPRHLDPAAVQNVVLVLFYQGRIDWPATR